MTGRVLGLDIGDRRIGIAVSDETRLIATPHSVYTRVGWGPDVKYLTGLYASLGCTLAVSGLPRNMDGTEGFQAQKVREFVGKLTEAGMQVEFQDERLSTVAAHEALIEGGMRREERKGVVDKVAAAVILQEYLDSEREKQTEETKMADEKDLNMNEEEFDAEETEEDDGIVELTDEEGQPVRFQHLATVEYEGEYYLALLPLDEDDSADDENEEVVLLKIEHDETNDEDFYATIEDDAVSDAVFQKFLQMMQEEDGEE